MDDEAINSLKESDAKRSPFFDYLKELLTERELKIFTMRYGLLCEKNSFREIADSYDVTVERINQIFRKSLKKLNKNKSREICDIINRLYDAANKWTPISPNSHSYDSIISDKKIIEILHLMGIKNIYLFNSPRLNHFWIVDSPSRISKRVQMIINAEETLTDSIDVFQFIKCCTIRKDIVDDFCFKYKKDDLIYPINKWKRLRSFMKSKDYIATLEDISNFMRVKPGTIKGWVYEWRYKSDSCLAHLSNNVYVDSDYVWTPGCWYWESYNGEIEEKIIEGSFSTTAKLYAIVRNHPIKSIDFYVRANKFFDISTEDFIDCVESRPDLFSISNDGEMVSARK